MRARHLYRLVPPLGLLANLIRHPGLRCGLGVEIDAAGAFTHGVDIRIGEGTRIELAPGSALALGDRVSLSRSVHISLQPECRMRIGAGTTVQDHCRIYVNVTIGRNCVFAPNVFMSSGTHVFEAMPAKLIQEQDRLAPATSRPIRIFGDCWFGINAVIAPGVTVGRGCVLGANTVLTADLARCSAAVGNPARVVCERLAFSPKPRIDAADEQDAPYVYDGFDLSRRPAPDGLVADAEFTLALQHPNARTVRLCMSGAGELALADQRKPVPHEPDVVEFGLDSACASLPFLTFRASSDCRVRWAELI
jgi:acetyltransferase-like isoleucine patch superfamily enzyme